MTTDKATQQVSIPQPNTCELGSKPKVYHLATVGFLNIVFKMTVGN